MWTSTDKQEYWKEKENICDFTKYPYDDSTSSNESVTTLFWLLSFYICRKLINTSFDFVDLDNENSGMRRRKRRAFIVDGYAWKSFEGRFKVMVKGKV